MFSKTKFNCHCINNTMLMLLKKKIASLNIYYDPFYSFIIKLGTL